MTVLVVLLSLLLAAAAVDVWLLRHDGRDRSVGPPRSHWEDRRFLPPSRH